MLAMGVCYQGCHHGVDVTRPLAVTRQVSLDGACGLGRNARKLRHHQGKRPPVPGHVQLLMSTRMGKPSCPPMLCHVTDTSQYVQSTISVWVRALTRMLSTEIPYSFECDSSLLPKRIPPCTCPERPQAISSSSVFTITCHASQLSQSFPRFPNVAVPMPVVLAKTGVLKASHFPRFLPRY
ncbi:hypothetical protein CONLIGDRAFT_284154 [Coniochaeta ligniaria NRRL 30616]|uniref:Uncharacterized protein n=1 Tax=Coniochaeta ligniaria NRRL 30616 TaxID=1408157 RepID=A0A1J7ITD2_9PEZI|nr:hypothetical protein CONLIGDRAFT_284154 [Coniochaeta ligniaria NRRL 30616]